MKKYTKYLFFFSFGMSLTSLFIIEKGYKELYPFASWKLFAVPSGGSLHEERYILYGLKGMDTIKINYITPSPYYDANDKALITDTYGKQIENNIDKEMSRKKLLIFAKDIEPNFEGYLLYKESYNPRLIETKAMKIAKKFIIEL
ncbi:hypothetical protein JI747_015395 [Chryseobacterium sp. RG1]|uniref:Uncharacterized protein n=1 Tax=Chryseobacterium tagetis TaxID=2801334 RepID=A0ABS8A3K6_9FLAO|nr:hypothetical protein [Chryseobacterium tagetis]MCA6068569.1 hypothetical protein [Chryseobacterium tagetis]